MKISGMPVIFVQKLHYVGCWHIYCQIQTKSAIVYV